MIRQYTAKDAKAFPLLFESMHCDRKRVFVDLLKWDIPHEGGFEIDQYDGPSARYLILDDPSTGEHLGSVRLLPTTGPHLMGDVFSHLCEQGVPVADDIWEITRFVVSPRVSRKDRLRVRNMLGRAMIEWGIAENICAYTCVCELGFLNQLLASNWSINHLGLPQRIGQTTVGALSILCTRSSIEATDPYWQVDGPVLVESFPALAA